MFENIQLSSLQAIPEEAIVRRRSRCFLIDLQLIDVTSVRGKFVNGSCLLLCGSYTSYASPSP